MTDQPLRQQVRDVGRAMRVSAAHERRAAESSQRYRPPVDQDCAMSFSVNDNCGRMFEPYGC